MGFDATVTVSHASLATPIVRTYTGLNKKQINKLGLALTNVLMKLSQMTDARAQGKKSDWPVEDGGAKTDAEVDYNVTEDGVLWNNSHFKWPNQSPGTMAFIVSMFDGEFANVQSHFDQHQIKAQGGKSGKGK